MLNKDQFIKRMSLIQNFHSQQETLSVLIDKITDGYSVPIIGNCLVNELIDSIHGSLEISDEDLLKWWLYEDVDKVIYDTVNNVEISVRTLEELYDYIVECKEEESEINKIDLSRRKEK